MSHSVSTHLRIDVADYDGLIRRFIPGYDQMIDRATTIVAAGAPRLVLDLGAGTGALAEQLLARTKTAVVQLWDVDDAMLAVAKARLDRFGDRAVLVRRSFDAGFPPSDGMMASLALHHITTIEAKTGLYARAAAALRPGGVLVNADITIPTEAPRQARLYRDWADHLVANGIDERRAWQHFDEWSDEDRYFSIEQELAALAAAGLEPSVPWRLGPATVMVGRVRR
jgi:tRNA (cmo5U34)-methyltransferase